MSYTATEASVATQKPAAQPTTGGSVYAEPQDIAWEPTQSSAYFHQGTLRGQAEGGDDLPAQMGAGSTLPMHKHPEIEQTFVIEG